MIALGGADGQRETVSELVEEHAKGWWHFLPDVWIVGGYDHKYWGELLRPVVEPASANLLVLELPREKDARMFAVRGSYATTADNWLWEFYHGRPIPELQPAPSE